MKASFNLSVLVATSSAHMTMVEPKWNYGSADTSKCDDIFKNTAGTPFNKASGLLDKYNESGKEFKLYHSCQGASSPDEKRQCMGSNEYKAFAQCLWKENRQSYWFNQGTQIGCPAATGLVCAENGVEGHTAPCCDDPMEPTLTSPDLLSLTSDVNATGNNRYNPWNAPGHAPVIDPCGVVGGFPWENPDLYFGGPDRHGSEEPCTDGCFVNGSPAPEQMQFKGGTRGSEVMHRALTDPDAAKASGEDQPVTQWTAGGVAEVSQGSLVANHGGGYQWRLCRAAEFTTDGIKNEECFQRSPLEYASSKSAIEFGAHHRITNETGGRRAEFDAVRVTDANTRGVMPTGSTWTKFPVPNCGPGKNLNCIDGPGETPAYLHGKPLLLNFPEPAPGVYGFGVGDLQYSHFFANSHTALEQKQKTEDQFDFTVVDRVKVPEQEGRYVLSWRWDSEEGPQIWSNCALVDIVKGKRAQKHSLRGSGRA